MKTCIVSRDRDEEMESREMVKALNLPNGCVVTTTNRYSTAISNSSVFVPGYNFDEEKDIFIKLEPWMDTVLEEGQRAYDRFKEYPQRLIK